MSRSAGSPRPAARARRRVPDRCVFCRDAAVAPGIVAETPHFTVVCDHAPLVPGHLLIIPRAHVACFAALPRARYAELRALQARVAAFLADSYGAPVFLERGVGARGRLHAHLHAVPVAGDAPDVADLGGVPVRGWAGLRRWYDRHGAYVYVEHGEQGYRLAPAAAQNGHWPPALALGAPAARAAANGAEITREVRARWQRFEQQHGRPTTRVVTCFVEHAGALCLLKRSAAVGSGRGKWHVVSGYLPDGKDPLQHIYDELAEETGLTADRLQLRRHAGPLLFADRAGGRPWEVDAYLFATDSPDVRLNWEHDDYAWVAPEAVARYDCLPWLMTLYDALGGER